MGSDAWFERFERIQAEHPEMSDDEASEAADEKLRDDYADRADQIKDERADRMAEGYDFSKGVRGKYVEEDK